MRLLVVSDTHGWINPVINYVKSHATAFDGMIHLGDHYRDAVKIGHLLELPVYAVRGNCDALSSAPEDLLVELSGKRVFLTHGHHYGVKYSLLRLHLKAVEEGVDLVCFGHTHVVAQVHEQGVVLFNPGSASEPRAGGYPSIGIIEIDDRGIHTKVVPLLGHSSE